MPFVHGFVGQAVGCFVAAAEGVAHFEAGNVSREAAASS